MLKYIIKAFNFVVAIIMLVSLCAVDSASWTPFIVLVASAAYLIAIAWWQEKRYEAREGEEE